MRIIRGDQVKIIAGSDKGKVGIVQKVLPKKFQVIVTGVNVVKKHVKSNIKTHDKIQHKELPIHVSNVVFCVQDFSVSKIGYKFNNGKKVRFLKKMNKILL